MDDEPSSESAKTPRCPLCSGPLAREKNVWVQTGGTNVLTYTSAWVCTICSAAFPIAVKGGLFKRPKPLYEKGERVE